MEIRVPPDSSYPATSQGADEKLTWAQYEAYVCGILEQLMPDTKIQRDVRLIGQKTGLQRQIDILVERDLGGFDVRIAVDCKAYKRRVNVNDVERFLGMLDDVRVSKGVLMTTKGYSKAAAGRVRNDARDIDLRILTAERLSEFHGLGGAILWKGSVAAAVRTPETWIVDNEHRSLTGSPEAVPQFMTYPLGHTRDSIFRRGAFVYGNIILKWPQYPTMNAIAELHEKRILERSPAARFVRLEGIKRESTGGREPEETILRVGYVDGYNGPEYSLYIDHPAGVLLLVLLCPEGQDELFVPVLKWIGQRAVLGDCVDHRNDAP
jgi:hypothetical protein